MKTTARLRTALAVTAAAYSFFTAAASAQIVNGGFELGSFSGWTVNDPSLYSIIGNDPDLAAAGTYHANLGASFDAANNTTPVTGSLSQTFNTAAGSLYTLSFSLANDGKAPPNFFEAWWNGTMVFSVVNAPFVGGGYSVVTVNNLLATGTSTTLEFRHRNEDDFFRLDEVTASAVPEPSTVSFAVLGIAVFGAISYRRSKIRRSAAR